MPGTTDTHARLAIAALYGLTSLIGFGLLFAFWASQSVAAASGRSLLFLLIMGCIHLAGYLLYVQQFAAEPVETSQSRASFEFSPHYWPALKFAIVMQFVFGVLTALMLDMGESAGFFKVALISHWLLIFEIVGRRPMSPTSVDVVVIRYGLVFCWFVAGLVAPWVWSIIGESPLSGWDRLFGD
ncbi:MAG: hypothetical protein WD669_00980 [Pirellulales bacterium]